jgi:hypothetical protein
MSGKTRNLDISAGFMIIILSTQRGNYASANKAPHPSPLPEGRGRKRQPSEGRERKMLPLCYLAAYLKRSVLRHECISNRVNCACKKKGASNNG